MLGCAKPSPPPHFTVRNAKIRLHSLGGRNYYLIYAFDYRVQSGDHWIEIVGTAGEKHFTSLSYSSSGEGVGHSSLELSGTFLNTGNTNRLAELMARIEAKPTWEAKLQLSTPYTFLEYDDLNGQRVTYRVRMKQKP